MSSCVKLMFLIQFETLDSTAACLFGLINGDEVFTTMNALSSDETIIYPFSLFYFYSFIILFIFGVANLFIAIIDNTYRRIKEVGDRDTKALCQYEIKRINIVWQRRIGVWYV